jgi:hypothetical protein
VQPTQALHDQQTAQQQLSLVALAPAVESGAISPSLPVLLLNPSTMQPPASEADEAAATAGDPSSPSSLTRHHSASLALLLNHLAVHFSLRVASSPYLGGGVDAIRPAFPSIRFVFAHEGQLRLEADRKAMAHRSDKPGGAEL